MADLKITRLQEVIDYENRWIQVHFDHARFPTGAEGRYTRIRHRSGIPGVAVVAVKVTAGEVLVGLIESYRYPVGRVCIEAVRGFGESGDHEDARRELGVDGALLALGTIDRDTGMVEMPVRLYGCLVAGERRVEPDPTEFTRPLWMSVDTVWAAVADGEITCAMTLAALLRAQLLGLLPAPGASPYGHVHRAVVASAAHGVEAASLERLARHPSSQVRAAVGANPHRRSARPAVGA